MPAWTSEILETRQSDTNRRILGLQRKENWNGFGGHAIPLHVCEAVISLLDLVALDHLPAPTSLGPSPRGAIGLEWRQDDVLLLAEVFSDSDIQYQLAGPGASFRDGNLTPPQLLGILKEIYPRP